MSGFKLAAGLQPKGDQPEAIEKLSKGLREGLRRQTLLGVTGSGKTFTMANVIMRAGRPTLVISHNKTLAAQPYEEFSEFFPENAVEYFVSYYDYYQPEAYVPQTDTYIGKETSINEQIERLRHSATQSLMVRNDVIVVASVSCIYGLGDPREYRDLHLVIEKGRQVKRQEMLRKLVDIQYQRNDMDLKPGTFRARGDVIDVFLPDGETVYRIGLFGDDVESIARIDPLLPEKKAELERAIIYPAKHFVTPPDRMEEVCKSIEAEADVRITELKRLGKVLEAARLEQRTRFDLEMLRQVGYCHGIENYSRHFTGRKTGEPPYSLLDYFPEGFLTFIDESHVTMPQVRGMYEGDRARKATLVEYGFRLPSALDNRPLKFPEFEKRVGQIVYVSATPSPYERETSDQVVEQLVRPTGLVDPVLVVRPIKGQVDDLLGEIRSRAKRGERVLVTTLTKRMAEDLTDYYTSLNVKVRYLHADVDTLDRIDILTGLRRGDFDTLVGINLLREGLDLPEVSLVAILDADKEGFLRGETALVQTIGRAARNVNGSVIMYADKVTDSMRKAIDETDRRRAVQVAYNESHGITPKTIEKAIREMKGIAKKPEVTVQVPKGVLSQDETLVIIGELEASMLLAAKRLDFEKAAAMRDKIRELRGLAGIVQEGGVEAGPERPKGRGRWGARAR
ncbi:MAG: excinuclease ABC subunit UvrB [Euryarchaeota archaeon]|nr:excinuclease ABC subunit UvrB [Euryarchaeota archaeon]